MAATISGGIGGESDLDATDERILETALHLFAEVGISRVSPDDIAKRAGINRVTLYRRLGSKDAIVRAAMLYETSRVLAGIIARLDGINATAERVTVGFAVTVEALRTNPILAKTLAVDTDRTLTAITVQAGEILTLATGFVANEIVMARSGSTDDTDTEAIAAMIVRLVHSLVLTPDAPPRLDTEDELRQFAAALLVPLIQSNPH